MHYVGNERDVGADLGHFHARPYDYQVGRFLGPDPLRLFPSWEDDASTAHLAAYNYTAGNPIGLLDPDGRAPIGEVLWNTFAGGDGPKVTAGGVGRGAQKVLGVIRPVTDFIDPEVQRQAAVNDISDGAVMIRSGDLKGGLAKIQSGRHRAMWFGTLVMGEMLLGARTRPRAKGAGSNPGSLGAMRRSSYESNPKHGATSTGRASAAPTNGQAALDYSISGGGNSSRRVGIDYATKEFVVFPQHLPGKYHGYVVPWRDLTNKMQAGLRKAGMADKKGRVLTD